METKARKSVLNKFTSAVTAISEATRDALVEFECIKKSDIDVVYNGIKPLEPSTGELSALKISLGLPENALVFGTVARLDPIKNQSMLIEAFAETEKYIAEAYLLIVGDGDNDVVKCAG